MLIHIAELRNAVNGVNGQQLLSSRVLTRTFCHQLATDPRDKVSAFGLHASRNKEDKLEIDYIPLRRKVHTDTATRILARTLSMLKVWAV